MSASETASRTHDVSGAGSGMLLMAFAMTLLPVGDTLSKILTQHAGSLEITSWRMLVQALLLMALAALQRDKLRGRVFSPLVVLSGALTVVVMASIITAFTRMPIATAIAIFFVEPLILTLLSGPLLGERAGPRRYAAVGVGLIGALIVLRPSFAEFGPIAVMPLIAATAYALNMIVVRKATREQSVLTLRVGASLSGLAILAVLMLCGLTLELTSLRLPEAPSWTWGLIGLAGALSAVTFLLISEAFKRSEASVLAPFQYLEIVGATALGYLVFGDFPDLLTWVGTAIILASGAYVFHRERKQNQPQKARGGRTTR